MQNFIQFQMWAETNVNFLYRVRAPFNYSYIRLFDLDIHRENENSGDTDQMPNYVASDLGLHCSLITTVCEVSRLTWVTMAILRSLFRKI